MALGDGKTIRYYILVNIFNLVRLLLIRTKTLELGLLKSTGVAFRRETKLMVKRKTYTRNVLEVMLNAHSRGHVWTS